MCYPLVMEIFEALSYLLEKPPASRLLDNPVGAMSLHIMVHTYAIHKVGNYADLLSSFYQVVHFDTVWMVNFPTND